MRALACALVLLVVAWAALPATVHAQSASAPAPDERVLFSEPESVFAASKYDQPLSQAPADVSIVTQAEISRYGWLTLADVLRGTRGFIATGDRNYDYVGVRGFARSGDYNGRILLLVDGHRVNDNIYDQALIGTENPVDLELVERIEIVRGPGSSLYGSNALYAVINLIMRRGRDVAGFEVAGLAGSRDTYGGRLTYGQRTAGGEFLLSLTAGETDGERNLAFPAFTSPLPSGNVAANSDGDRWMKALATWRQGDFTLQGVYAERTRQVPTGPFNAVFGDPRNRTEDIRGWIEGRYDTALDDGRMRARLALDDYQYKGDLVQQLAPDVVNQDRSHGTWWSGELAYSRTLDATLQFVVGADGQADARNQQANTDRMSDAVGTRYLAPALDDSRHNWHWGAYGQFEWHFAPQYYATLGLRYDDYKTFGGSTSPRLALIYLPSSDATLKFIYGKAFRAPNAYELYYQDGGASQKPNEALQPETVRGAEAVAEWRFAPGWRGVATYYWNRIADLVTTMVDPGDGLLVNVNQGSETAQGIEAEIDGRTAGGLEVYAALTSQVGTVLTGTPRTQFKARASTPVPGTPLVAALEVLYQSQRTTLAGAAIGGQTLTNLTLTAPRVWRNVDLSLGVRNLFDAQLDDPAGAEQRGDRIPQPGRQVWFRAVVAF